MREVKTITAEIFRKLEDYLETAGLNEDKDPFHILKEKLNNFKEFSADEFAYEAIYVILASGFRQKTAKVYYQRVLDSISEGRYEFDELIEIFRNKHKVRGICDIWNNRQKYRDEFYAFADDLKRINYLKELPYIGEITKNHLARNLGYNFTKYDVWIQRIAVVLYGSYDDVKNLNTGVLKLEIKNYCDFMFGEIEERVKEKIGYIDVVLWRACTEKILMPDLVRKKLFIDRV
jgi:hypothetical protein